MTYLSKSLPRGRAPAGSQGLEVQVDFLCGRVEIDTKRETAQCQTDTRRGQSLFPLWARIMASRIVRVATPCFTALSCRRKATTAGRPQPSPDAARPVANATPDTDRNSGLPHTAVEGALPPSTTGVRSTRSAWDVAVINRNAVAALISTDGR